MSDQQTTLLKFDGDASGAKAAAAEQIAAVKQTAEAVKELQAAEEAANQATERRARHGRNMSLDMTGMGGPGPAAEIEKAAGAADKLTEATDQAGESLDRSGKHANTLAEVVSRIDPQLGALIRTGGKLDEVFAAAFSPAGLMTGGLVAALAAVSAIVSTIQESIEKTKRDLADMEAAKARIARDKLEAAGEVGKALAARGAGSEGALERATGLAKSLENQGFERSTAVQVAAAGEAGGMPMSDADLRRLAMGVQLGAVNIEGGRTAAETQAVLQKAIESLASMPADLQAALESGIEQTIRGKSLGSLREAAEGTQGFLEDSLQRRGFEGESLKEKAEKVRSALRGPQQMWDFDEGGGAYQRMQTQEEFEKLQAEGLALVELLKQDVKSKEQQLAGQRERVRRIAMAAPPSAPNAAAEPKPWSETFQEERDSERHPARHRVRSVREGAGRVDYDPNAQNQPIVVNNNFHGVNNVGTRDPRLLRKPRQRGM